jgi:hypothetical protein
MPAMRRPCRLDGGRAPAWPFLRLVRAPNLTCSSCGYVKHWDSREVARARGAHGMDDYFHLPYWLRAQCRHGIVFAVNEEHLAYMLGFFGANLRERRRGPYGWSNASFISRLPVWMKAAKNRAEIMSCLGKLERRLRGPSKDLS